MRRVILVAFLVLASTWATSAQKVDVDELAILARAAPPEIAANTLIRLATGVNDLAAEMSAAGTRKRLALLDEAWALADNVQQPAALRPAPGSDPAASSAWQFRSSAYEIDRLSLKSRIAAALLRDRPVEARNRFLTLSVDAPSLTCRDDFVYDFNAYYSAAQRIVASGFTPTERARGEHVAFLERVINGIRSASQVQPALPLLTTVQSAEDLSRLAGLFASALNGITGDDRSFSASADILSSFMDEILSGFIELLAHYDLVRHSRGGWLAKVSEFMIITRSIGGVEIMDRVRQRFAASGHPPLKAVAAISAAIPSFPF